MSIFEVAIGEEGSPLCAQCAETGILPFGEHCWRCNRLSPQSRTCDACRRTGSPGHVWITTDHDNLARDLLSFYKFGHHRPAAEPIARMMLQTFDKYALVKDYLVVPVPTATSRIRERGFGHTELLARVLSHALHFPYSNNLRRLGQTRQLGAKREERLVQLSSSFAVKQQRLIQGRHILLVDDVVTTGGTIISAAKALRSAKAASIDALLFAKRL
jgi:ComF family protein